MTSLVQYEQARAALAEATRVDEILAIRDEVEHVKLYAKQIKDQALLAEAAEFQMRVERRLGFVIVEAKKAGHFAEGRPKKNGSAAEPFPAVTLAEAGVDKKLSMRAQKASSIAERAFEAMVSARRERIMSGKAIVVDVEPGGARAIMGSRQEPHDSLDYFPTPPWATRALVEHVFQHLGVKRFETVWEPCCGEGHMAEALSEYFHDVAATDIHDYGYGAAGHDFLKSAVGTPTDWIIGNPPFGDMTEAFVLRALELAQVGVAMFVRLQWLESVGRYEAVFKDHPPTLIAFFAERVPLCKGRWDPEGSTATAYIWLVWLKDAEPRPPFWIPPGQREALTQPDDVERFTARPVKKSERPPASPTAVGGIPDEGGDHGVTESESPRDANPEAGEAYVVSAGDPASGNRPVDREGFFTEEMPSFLRRAAE